MNDNKLFIMSVVLLAGLTVLGTALQTRPAPPAAAIQTKSAVMPPGATVPQTVAPASAPQPSAAPAPAPAAKPQIRGYNGGEFGDD